MSSKKKINSLAKTDEGSIEESTRVTSTHTDNNELLEKTEISENKDLKIIFIPKSQHEHFECVVGKNVFIDKPWTKISHKKIMEDLQLQNTNSCFWQFRKKLEGIKNENVLVGYKPFSSTDEEFVICITDKAIQYIEETQTQMEYELKQKVERSILRVSGPWESKNSEKDIEEINPKQTREKITYKWKLPVERLQAKAEFENSNSKTMKNEYVKLEPRSKEIFEISDMLTMDSSVQAVRKMENKEIQTIPRIKDNKCIQSVAVEEEMFQLQPLTEPNKALDDFLEKHVPNLVNELYYNELYDLYRDDYKLLNNENDKQNKDNSKNIQLLPGYQNLLLPKKYVSSHSWHPTIPGIFAVSYTTNSNALYKSVQLETNTENDTKSTTVKDEKYDISYGNEEYDQKSWNNQPESKLIDENYKEKIMSLLNKEFVQRMRIIQVNDDEKMNEQYSKEITGELRNSLIYASHEQLSTYKDLPLEDSQTKFELLESNQQKETMIKNENYLKDYDNDFLNDENIIIDETQPDDLNNIDQWNKLNLDKKLLIDNYGVVNNVFGIQNKEIKEATNSTKMLTTINVDEVEDKDVPDHHDSDTESFYNIWNDDKDWLYGNKLRNVVRNIHRKFNNKYDREAREDKLFNLLKSEAKYTERKYKFDDMTKERLKLTKDMFEAGDKYQQLKRKQNSKFKNKSETFSKQDEQYKILQNDEEFKIKQENTPLVNEQNNSVIIWSINDNIFPKLRLESPEEVCCVEFNPRDGNTVVGGLINGQICIWDIKGKLEETDSSESNMSKLEKKHHDHLWMHMKWSLDVNFKTKIRPAALSAILESHEAMVTAIQWIHPMNEITLLGKLITMQEGHFSDQFFSAAMDGTIKLWDLHSTPMAESKQKSKTDTRFGHPENLNNYRSPLNIYNNRLKPSYTIIIKDPDNAMQIPITALSFEIPLMQYNYTSTQPLVIGKRQFEYVPTIGNVPSRILVVGNIMGQIGVVTWNGYDTYQSGQNVEECKHIWWGYVHNGPINCIKRNAFFPDIHLVCGGHVVSVWSLNYKGGPLWWKRFDDFTNSVLWSTIHPAEFRISFNNIGVLQFWNLMKYTHQPYYTFDFFLSDGVIATLSAPHPSIHFIGKEWLKFAEGINEILNYNKNELISFSDSTGAIMMITVNAIILEPDEIDEIGRVFQKEVDWRIELDVWNDKYKEEFGSIGENNMDDRDYKSKDIQVPTSVQIENPPPTLTPEQIKRKICDDTFKWYFNQRESQLRLGKNKEKYLEREKRYMIEIMMKKKNVDQKQLEDYFNEIKGEKHDEYDINKIRFNDDETYKDIVNKLLATENNEEYVFDIDSKRSTDSGEIKNTFDKIHQMLVTDIVDEKEKLSDYIKNNPYKAEQEDWARVIEFAEREIRDRLNDQTLLKSPGLRMMRRKLAKKYIDEGYKIKEWRSRKDEHACDRYKIRENKINKLKAMYGKNYNPYWDKNLQPQKMKDAIRMRVAEEIDEEQSYNYFEGEGDGDNCSYSDYLSLMESNSISNYPDRSGKEISVHNDNEGSTPMMESDDSSYNRKRWDTELFEHEQTSNKDLYGNRYTNNEYNEYQDLETLDEQDHQMEEN